MENKKFMTEELEMLRKSIKGLQTFRNVGMSPITYLGISLFVLKITNLITWSWSLVLIPFFVPFILALIPTITFTKKLYLYADKLAALREKELKENDSSDSEKEVEEVITIPIVIELIEREGFDSNTDNAETDKKTKKVKKNKKKEIDDGEGIDTTAEKSRITEGTSTLNN